MADDSTGLLGQNRRNEPPIPTDQPLYREQGQTSTAKFMQYAFVAIVIIMVGITVILSLYRAVVKEFLYFLMGVSLVGLLVIQMILILFMRRGDLGQEKIWFSYFVGGCIVLEAIFTNVLLFQ